MTSKTTDIRASDHGARFKARFGLYIDSFLHYFFKVNGFPVLLLYLDFNKRLETFLKIANHG